ncbi:MAG: SCO family protein [Alphaproteobacteria bacterium TMED89]|nr:SCO family protein [Rhodospirillaceae bacterium]RPH11192.1 MAG: SCO family protein [Alphaproteobacteria bacterium TMED89]
MRVIGGALAVIVACGFAVGYAFWPAPPARGPMQIGGDFALIHESGDWLDTAQAFAGRPLLLYFGYTYCPDVCPTTLLDMVTASEATNADEALIFVSVDPARDTAAELKAYTDMFSPDLHGFTGSAAQIEAVKADWAIYSARHDTDEFSDYLLDHTTLVFLTDEEHQVVEVFRNGTSPTAIATSINARF